MVLYQIAMIHLLLGNNIAAKKAYIHTLAQELGLQPERISTLEDFSVDMVLQADLFSPTRLLVFVAVLSQLDWKTVRSSFVASPHTMVFLETTLDKRKKATTEILKDPAITIHELVVPTGSAFVEWVAEYVKKRGAKIEKSAAIAVATNFSNGEFLSEVDVETLCQELAKLSTYADTEAITVAMVEQLISRNPETDALDIANALASGDTSKALVLVEKFFGSGESDDKAKLIQLSALLAEQLRSIVLVQDCIRQYMTESSILELTGWKSGRLYMVKRTAQKMSSQKVLSMLRKLELLDLELKTSSLPGRAVLELIIMQG